MATKKREQRYRDFATIIYPDSENTPDNWMGILQDMHIPCFISPLHDKDVSEDGNPKKPHYHLMTMYDSVKTKEQAIEVFQAIGGVGCEVVKTRRGHARYLCHLDDYNKAQYSKDDVIQFGGADYEEVISLISDKYAVLREMICFIKENGVTNIFELIDYAEKENLSDWWRMCMDKPYIINIYVQSSRDRISQVKKVQLEKFGEEMNKLGEEIEDETV